MESSISTVGSDKPTKFITAGEWEGWRVEVIGGAMCTGHDLEPVDHYGEPTDFLMCSQCFGIAVKPFKG